MLHCSDLVKQRQKAGRESVCSGFRNAEPPCNTRQHVIRIEIMAVQIFLSTVTDEFCDYRDQLRSDLTRHNVEVKVQEDFKDYGVVTLDKLDLYISTCDAVVCHNRRCDGGACSRCTCDNVRLLR